MYSEIEWRNINPSRGFANLHICKLGVFFKLQHVQSTSIISCHRSHLEARCRERGYTLDEVMPCVVALNGDEWTIDADHTAYPRGPRQGFVQPQHESAPLPHGPGAELHALLGRFGLAASGDCKCTSRAAYMDQMGCDWCEANIEEIVGWLRESAAERGLPFLDVAGMVLVRRAIANAQRKEQARAKEAETEGGAAAG